jgi:hypothetical protein
VVRFPAFAALLLVALGASAAAGAGASMRSGTNPKCLRPGGDAPGVLRGGVYVTRCFLPGMRVTVPRGWAGIEDSPIEFKIQPDNAPNQDVPAFRFWIDPHAAPACGVRFLPVDVSTPTKMVSWLKSNKNLIVTDVHRTTIAGHIPATSVELNVARRAPRCDPSCPAACIGYFIFRAPGITPTDTYGTGPGEPVRLYFAQIGRPTHLFAFNVDTQNKHVFAKLSRVATRILATLRFPSKLPSRRGR